MTICFKSGFCCIYWISSALSSLTQHMCTCLFDWQPMGPKWVIHCSFVCTPNWDMRKIQDCEAKTMATSYVGLWQSQIGAAKAQSREHVVLSRAVLAVSAYCLQHLTIQHEVSCSGVKFSGPQKCYIVLCAQKDELVDCVTKHNCKWCLAIFVISSLTLFHWSFFTAVWSGALMLHVHTIWKGTLWSKSTAVFLKV